MTTSTGFSTEYLKVNSASRQNAASDTDLSGNLYVTRAYGSGQSGDSGSLGGSPGAAQSYSGSQVIVSTGKIDSGYIRLNANPNDAAILSPGCSTSVSAMPSRTMSASIPHFAGPK